MTSIDDQIEAVRKQLVELPGWAKTLHESGLVKTNKPDPKIVAYGQLMNEFQRLHAEKLIVKEFLDKAEQL